MHLPDKDRLKKVSTAITIGSVAFNVARNLKARYDDKHTYSLRVDSNAYIFNDVMVWIRDNTDNVQYSTLLSRHDSTRLAFDMNRVCSFYLDGHKITVYREQNDKPKVVTDAYGDLEMTKAELIFQSKSLEGIHALKNKFEEIRADIVNRDKSINCYSNTTYGWGGRKAIERPIDSIFLPGDSKVELIEDFEKFMDSEDQYAKMGAPWHRGYLFYGPPGNGKSSMAAALASTYKKHIYSLSLSSISDDNVLMERITAIEAGSILLLEDLDIFSASVTRESEQRSVTLAGLLNALDGVATPHGLITIMTTNRLEELDPALVRPGRMDFKLELKEPEAKQIKDLFRYIYGEDIGVEPKQFKSMAEYVNLLKYHIGDPEGARLEIKE